MGQGRMTIFVALVLVLSLVISACGAAPTPTPTPTKPAAAPTKPAEKPTAEATKPAAEPTKAAESAKPAAVAPKPPEGPLPKSLTVGTLSPGSTLNAVATGLSKVATDAGQMQVIVQPFSGGPAWIPQMMSAGKPEAGVLNVVEAWEAFTGKATPKPLPGGATIPNPYDKAHTELRGLLTGTDLIVGILVKKDSKYQTPEDLKGARVAWGFKAHPGNALATYANFALAGMTANDVKVVEVPDATAGVRALQEGRVDATCAAVGMGVVAEADAQVGVRFLDAPSNPTPENMNVAQGIMPGARITKVKGGSSAGLPKDTNIWSYQIIVVTSTKLPDNVAYTLVKTWWDNNDKLKPLHVSFQNWTTDLYVSKTVTIPYHPGAVAFYKEKGVWPAEMDQNQQVLMKGELPFLK